MNSSLDLLKGLLEEGRRFTFENFSHPDDDGGHKYGGPDTPEWLAWKTRSINVVRSLSSDNSPATRLTVEALEIRTQGNGPDRFERQQTTLLRALEITATALQDDLYGELRTPTSTSKSAELSNKVFIVHGHDDALKTDIERFLHEIGMAPVVLHREPDQGKTIIEKFESYSDVGYAFILLTPDDVAYPKDHESLPDDKRRKELRARPNVIFEFGYFVGRLGRNRVCCLHKEGVILPSDLDGLIYKKVVGSVDSQAYAIIKERQIATPTQAVD